MIRPCCNGSPRSRRRRRKRSSNEQKNDPQSPSGYPRRRSPPCGVSCPNTIENRFELNELSSRPHRLVFPSFVIFLTSTARSILSVCLSVCLSVKSPASPEIADWDGIPSIRLPAIFDELTAPPPPSRAAKRCRQNAEDAPKDAGTRRAVRGIGYRRMSSYLIFSMVTTRTA